MVWLPMTKDGWISANTDMVKNIGAPMFVHKNDFPGILVLYLLIVNLNARVNSMVDRLTE
jgi:hypothetical protein